MARHSSDQLEERGESSAAFLARVSRQQEQRWLLPQSLDQTQLEGLELGLSGAVG